MDDRFSSLPFDPLFLVVVVALDVFKYIDSFILSRLCLSIIRVKLIVSEDVVIDPQPVGYSPSVEIFALSGSFKAFGLWIVLVSF